MKVVSLVLVCDLLLRTGAQEAECGQALGGQRQPALSSVGFRCDEGSDGKCLGHDDDSFSLDEMRSFVASTNNAFGASAARRIGNSVDPSTIQGKVLTGYQGWVGAGPSVVVPGYGWRHWAHNSKSVPSASNAHIEFLPELGEYPKQSLYNTELKYQGNGSTVGLYGNVDEGVVDLHFKWMKDYGLDGVMLQRFIHNVNKAGVTRTHKNILTDQVDAACRSYGRVWAMRWDISGASAKTWDTDIKNDWKNFVSKWAKSPQYLKEGGRPVVSISHIGEHDAQHDAATPATALALVKWLKSQGLYVISTGPYFWSTPGVGDALTGFDEVHAEFDAIMPWAVGRYSSVEKFKKNALPQLQKDLQVTRKRGQHYGPVAWPGYSYRDNNKFNEIKRNAGLFFKAQIDAYVEAGATFYMVAMFDEVQEGTAIYKLASQEADSAEPEGCFLTTSTDGVDCPSDFYLKMVGDFTARAHGQPTPSPAPTPTPSPVPTSDVLLRGQQLASGESLKSQGGTAQLQMQKDGNLVLMSAGKEVWSSGTHGNENAYVTFQKSDGNLVLRAANKTGLWRSGSLPDAAEARLQDDCDLVIDDASAAQLWHLGVSCYSGMLV